MTAGQHHSIFGVHKANNAVFQGVICEALVGVVHAVDVFHVENFVVVLKSKELTINFCLMKR